MQDPCFTLETFWFHVPARIPPHLLPPPPHLPVQDPCLTLVLRDVICPTCQDCRDIDLCRDPAVSARVGRADAPWRQV